MTDCEARRDTLLVSLGVAVPMWQLDLLARRLPADVIQREARECSAVIAEKGDVLQFGGKGCADAFNALAKGIALASMCPGGAEFMGRHWCTDHDVCRAAEASAAGGDPEDQPPLTHRPHPGGIQVRATTDDGEPVL